MKNVYLPGKDPDRSIIDQIPENFDVVHFFSGTEDADRIQLPYTITFEGNRNDLREFDMNTIFVSKNHAHRYGSDLFIYNGIDWDDYTTPVLDKPRNHFHSLAKAAWKVKNVQGALNVIKKTGIEKLEVLGGVRFNLKMGIRFTFSPKVGSFFKLE